MLLALLLLFGALFEQHTVAAAVAVDRDALAAAFPGRAVNLRHEPLRNIVRQVNGHRDRVVDPFLDRTLHLDLGHPVDVVGRSPVVGRSGHPLPEFLVGDRRELRRVVSVRLEPLHEVVVVDVVFLELFARFILIVHMRVLVGGVDLAAALVDRAEHRLDARRGLRHERRGTRGGDGQHGDVAAADLLHLGVEFRVGLADAGDHRIVLLLGCVVDREGTALGGHLHRSPVSLDSQRLLHLDGECDRLLGTVYQSQCGEHVAFGRDAEARTAALLRHAEDLLPQLQFHAAHVLVLGVGGDLLDDLLDFFQFEVDDVVHHAHGHGHVRPELVEIELRILLERVVHIAQQIERQQAARIVGAERDFTAGVGRNRHEALVGIAVGHAFADDRIPEQYARLGRLPGIVDDLVPELPGVDILLVSGVVRIDRELLVVFLAGDGGTHELVVDLDRNVGARDLARVDLGVDETLGIGVLDRQREHQRTAAAVLRHLARRVGIALHERHDTRRRERRVEHRTARGTDVREVVPHAPAALHQLHLLLVHAEDAAVGVGRMLVPDHETVRERGHLEIVADTRHRATLGDHIPEMIQQAEDLLARHRIGILALDALDLGCDTLVHLSG